MYADKITPSMAQAIDETNRRRAKQMAYNLERGVDPQPLRKKIADLTDLLAREDADTEEAWSPRGPAGARPVSPVPLSSERNRDLGARCRPASWPG